MLVCGAALSLLETGAVIWLDIRPAQRSYRMILSNLFRMVRHGSSLRVVMNLNHSKYERTYHTIPSLSVLLGSRFLLDGCTAFAPRVLSHFSLFTFRFRSLCSTRRAPLKRTQFRPIFFQRTFFSECLLLKNDWRPQASKCEFGRRQSGVDTPRQAPCKGAAGKSRKIGSRERRWTCYLKINRFFSSQCLRMVRMVEIVLFRCSLLPHFQSATFSSAFWLRFLCFYF